MAAYVPLNPNTPSGPTQAPDAYSASDLANVRAIRDMLVSGLGDVAWDYSQSPAGYQNPNYYLWKNAGTGQQLRASMTYGGAPAYGPATITWEWKSDGASAFVQIGAVVNVATDAAGIINSASSLAGGFINALAARAIGAAGVFGTSNHAAGVGPAVHGLGTMSTQNANNVAISGGQVLNAQLAINQIVNFTRIFPIAPVVIGPAAWDWSTNGAQQKIPPGTVVPNIVNCQPGEIKRLWVTGPGAITIGSGGGVAFQWATGHPVWGAAATIVSCVAVEGTYIIGTTIPVG